ncbi:hypothetical protein Ga0061061_11163 [Chelatococcus sambhunathii]|nr:MULTISPECIES: DUF6163 family protein [Chelatococcus]CUA90116.1 hypothetical protein Ga0061061_11163 [Chelatococcus sambhunathii]
MGMFQHGGDDEARGGQPGEPPGTTRGLLDAIALHERAAALRWDQMLVWFMRVMACAWLVKGLGAWAVLLGFGPGEGVAFEARSLSFQATIIYFAVIDLVAAVGLWLTSTWGGVMWLLAVTSHIILALFFPRIVMSNAMTLSAFVSLILLYLAISWKAARQED